MRPAPPPSGLGSALRLGAGGLALVAAALAFDAPLLHAAGGALALLGLGTAAWVTAAAGGARVHRRLDGRRVCEDEPLPVHLEVLPGGVPLPPGSLHESLLPAPVPLAAGTRPTRIRVEVRFARRGRRRLQPAALVLGDPLGLATARTEGGGTDEVLVLPRTEPVRFAARGGQRGGLPGPRGPAAAHVEMDGLQPHVEGSPASRIHWPAAARGLGLVERRLISEGDDRPVVILDPRGPASPEALDAAVRAAASLVLHLSRSGGCALLLPGDRRPLRVDPDGAAWPAAHSRLALVDERPGAPPFSAAAGFSGAVVYVAARALDRPPRVLARTPGACVLVVPGALPGRAAAFSVAGCRGYAGTSRAAVAVARAGGRR